MSQRAVTDRQAREIWREECQRTGARPSVRRFAELIGVTSKRTAWRYLQRIGAGETRPTKQPRRRPWSYALCPHGAARRVCRQCDRPLPQPSVYPVRLPRAARPAPPVTRAPIACPKVHRIGYVPPAGSIALALLGRDRVWSQR